MAVVINGTTGVSGVDGSAGTPSYQGTDSNTGIFFPAADTIAFAEGGAEAMRIDSSGNVGIGTTPKTYSLGKAIEVGFNGCGINGASQTQTTLTSNAYYNSAWKYGGTGKASIMQLDAGACVWFTTDTSGSADGSITFAERMRITSGGSVLVGGSSSVGVVGSRIFEVQAGSSQTCYTLNYTPSYSYSGVYNAGDSQTYNFWKSGNNYLFGTVTNPDTSGWTERARITSGGYFKASNDGTYENSTGTYHEYKQTANSAALFIRASNASYTDQVLYLKATRTTTNTTFNLLLAENGDGTGQCVIRDSGNVLNTNNSYGSLSDIKIKQDVVDANSQWDDIKNLRIRKFRLKSDVKVNPDAKPLLGLVAQEAELVSPGLIEEAVDYEQIISTREVEKTREVEVTPAVLDDEGNVVEPAVTQTETYTETEEYTERVATGTVTKSVKYSILYMKAVKALQEAMTRIETLEAEVAAMKGAN